MPPLNLYDASATDLRDMFTAVPNLSPYNFQPIPYARQAKRSWERLTRDVDFREMDGDEVKVRNAILKSEGLPARSPVVWKPRRTLTVR